jgi:hypothetical protein
MPTAIQPIHYNGIIDSIKEGLCVPFLGAGVNVSSGDYKGLPLAYEVALQMVKPLTNLNKEQLENLTKASSDDIRLRLAQVVAGLNEQEMRNLTETAIEEHLKGAGPLPSLLRASLPDLARVALHIEVEMGFPYLLKRVQEILLDTACQPSPMLQALAELPLKLIVTTNYDRLLERAFGDRPFELVVQPVTGFSEGNIKQLEQRLSLPKGPILYKIHGSFGDNGTSTDSQASSRLILTEEDYIQFLSIVGRQDIGMPTLITGKLMKATILFLGYSLQDWDFRTIYKALIEPIDQWRRPISFAIQKNPPDFWVRYWERKGVTLLDVDLYEFAAELQKRWQSEAGR